MPEGADEILVGEIQQVDVGVHHLLVELVGIAQEITHHRLVQTLFVQEELGDIDHLLAEQLLRL